MNTGKVQAMHTSHAKEQTENNTTSWIGCYPGNKKEISKGQTFLANSGGSLEGIEVLPTFVNQPAEVLLTIHDYDADTRKWGEQLGSAKVSISQSDCGKWIRFNIPNLQLSKGKFYGFKLASHNSFIGIAEAVGSAKNPPLSEGREWKFEDNGYTDSFRYMSLAFKIAVKAA